MKLKQVIEELSKLPQDHEVFLAIDEEGNGYRLYAEAEESHFLLEDREAVHPDDVGTEYPEEDLTKVVILWP